MGSYNWINFDATCPACGQSVQIRCQTHVASTYAGDESGAFSDRDYRLGERMAWWPPEDRRYPSWRIKGYRGELPGESLDREACYSTCPHCSAELYVVIEFRDLVPERVLAIGLEEDWPEGYWK